VPLPGESNEAEHCDDCLTVARPWAQGRAALLYKDTARRLVLALKHGDRHDIVLPAARWTARALRPILPEDPLLVPVPLNFWRLAARRYNQSALLAKTLAAELDCDWCPDALIRPRRTPSLDGRSRDDRFGVLQGAIEPHPKRAAALRDRAVVIVDDVMTSGATLGAATEACHASGASRVVTVVLARVAKDT